VIDLILIVIFSVVLVPLVEFSSGALRIALGLIFVLFSPGYSLIAALFPGKKQLSGIERVALGLGMSIAVVPLLGLILNYTPWGIPLYPILLSVLAFIVAMAVVAWHRRRRLPPGERFRVGLRAWLPSVRTSWAGQGRWDRTLSVLLVLAIVATMATLAYVIAQPRVGERFTEFYILGPEGKAEGYPEELVLGNSARVVLGIVNREHEITTYRVEIIIDGEMTDEPVHIILNHEERWEDEVGFAPTRAGPDQKVEFLLYREGDSEPYLGLHLWIDVEA